MKTFAASLFFILIMTMACRSPKSETPEIKTPAKSDSVVVSLPKSAFVPDTHAIGQGVEIYRALLNWHYITRYTRVFTTGIILGDMPLFRYDDIKRYYQLVTPAGSRRIAFEMNKKVFTGFSQDGSVLGKAFINPQSASDTGFVVTLNKEPIYFAYYRSRTFGSVIEQNLAFVRVQDRDRYNQLQENILPVLWDTIYSQAQTVPRPEPDPRYYPRLLERLRKDKKLTL